MEMTVEKITPEKARQYLKANKDNYRRLSRTTVNRYAEDMKAGKWELNGEGIMFDENGILKNGQHRLAAIAQAGIAVEMTVIRGVANDVKLYDSGSVRTVSQIASNAGMQVDKRIASVANIIVNNFQPQVRGKTVDYIRKNISELQRAARCSIGSGNYARAGNVAAAYLMLRTKTMPSYEVELFFHILQTGKTDGAEGYETSSPLIARRMMDERKGQSGQRSQKECMDIVTQAMLDFHNGYKRETSYKVAEPFSYETYLTQVRKTDGLM